MQQDSATTPASPQSTAVNFPSRLRQNLGVLLGSIYPELDTEALKRSVLQAFFGDGRKFGVNITYSREDEPLGTAGPLNLVREQLTETFLVMNGDILTDIACRTASTSRSTCCTISCNADSAAPSAGFTYYPISPIPRTTASR